MICIFKVLFAVIVFHMASNVVFEVVFEMVSKGPPRTVSVTISGRLWQA